MSCPFAFSFVCGNGTRKVLGIREVMPDDLDEKLASVEKWLAAKLKSRCAAARSWNAPPLPSTVFGLVIGKLLYELNPAAWKSAAARVADDTPPDGAIDDYLELVDGWDKLDLPVVRGLDSTVNILANEQCFTTRCDCTPLQYE